MSSPTKPTRLRMFAGALLLAPLALAACGGDDDDSTDTDAERVISAPAGGDTEATAADSPAEGDPGDSSGGADRDEWIAVGAESLDGGDREFDECLSAGVVDGIGYENLAASDATPEDFWSASDVTTFGIELGDMDGVAENLTECGNLVDYFAAVSGGNEVQVACMREFFDDEDVANVIVTSMLGAEPSDDLLAKQTDMRACAEEDAG